MNTQSNSAQNSEQDKTCQKLSANFIHRLPVMGDEANSARLTDAVNDMTDRAKAILLLLSSQFTDDDVDKFNNDILYRVIDSVIQEIEDIRTVVYSFHDAQNAQAKGGDL